MQMEEGINFVKAGLVKDGDKFVIDQVTFDKETGVGIVITEADTIKLVDDEFAKHKADIEEKKYDFQFNKILFGIKETCKWVDSKLLMKLIADKQVALLGEKPKSDGKREGKQNVK